MTNERALLESQKLWLAMQNGKDVDDDITNLISQLTEEQFELVMSKHDGRHDNALGIPKILPKSMTVCDPGQRTLNIIAKKAGIL